MITARKKSMQARCVFIMVGTSYMPKVQTKDMKGSLMAT